jgi:5-methylcytosine-specific restriction endonuclease McrA
MRVPWNKGKKASAESRLRMSLAHIGKSPSNKGVPLSLEARSRLRSFNLGKKQSPETIAKRVAKLRGKKRSAEICAKFRAIQKEIARRAIAENGFRISPEQREAISAKLKGRKLPEEHKAKIKAWAQANKDKCTPPPEHWEKLRGLYKGKPFSGASFSHKGRIQSADERARRRKTAVRGTAHHNYVHGLSKQHQKERNCTENIRWRKACLERDNFTCQDCGARDVQLTVHHIKPFAKFKELRFEVSNGITLCEECHAKVDKWFLKYKLLRERTLA